jgi:hypothetical protein
VREFVSQHHELRRWLQSREDLNASAAGRYLGAIQFLGVVDRYTVRDDRRFETIRRGARLTAGFGRLGRRRAIGLRNVEDVGGTEPHNGLGVAVRCVDFLPANDRRQNRDALFALPRSFITILTVMFAVVVCVFAIFLSS